MQTAHGKKNKIKTIYIFAEWKDGNVLNRIRILKEVKWQKAWNPMFVTIIYETNKQWTAPFIY